jgi:membrane protein DedA with SNARE-associated domain
MLPLVRSFTSVVAGFTGVPAVRFGILSAIGTVIYATAVASIGYAVGSAWHTVERYMAFASYLIAAVVIAAIVFFVIHRLRELRREAQAAPAAAGEDSVRNRAPRG